MTASRAAQNQLPAASRGLTGSSIGWRWTAYTLVAPLAITIALAAVAIALGHHSTEAFPSWILTVTVVGVAVAGGQSRLLRGVVSEPRRWLVIGGGWAALVAGGELLSGTATPPPLVGLGDYLQIAAISAVLATAQWWFVLRPDLSRSAFWPLLAAPTAVATTVLSRTLDNFGPPGGRDWGCGRGRTHGMDRERRAACSRRGDHDEPVRLSGREGRVEPPG